MDFLLNSSENLEPSGQTQTDTLPAPKRYVRKHQASKHYWGICRWLIKHTR